MTGSEHIGRPLGVELGPSTIRLDAARTGYSPAASNPACKRSIVALPLVDEVIEWTSTVRF
jgi:hypothetical protein